MPSPKIVIVLSPKGIESVTVSAADSNSRSFGYELCRKVENEISSLGEAIRGNFAVYEQKETVKQ